MDPITDQRAQLKIDFTRSEQLAAIRDAELPRMQTRHGGGVSPLLMKALLRVLDDHGRGRECFLSFDTIARECQCSDRQARRGVESLKTLSLVCVERKKTAWGGVCNHYRIVWSELLLLRSRAAAPRSKSAGEAAEQTAIQADQTAMVTRPNGHAWPTKRPLKRTIEPPPPNPLRFDDEASSCWAAAEEELRKFSVGVAHRVIAGAQTRGDGPQAFLDRVHFAIAMASHPVNRAKLTSPAGALVTFLEEGYWGADLIDLDEADRLADEQQAKQRSRRQEADDNAAREAESAEKWAQINATCAQQLAAMSDEECGQLAERSLAPFHQTLFRQSGRDSPLVRELLLHALWEESLRLAG